MSPSGFGTQVFPDGGSGGQRSTCAEVWWGNGAVRVQRVLGSGVETVLWPDPRWFLWASELLFIPAEVSERLLETLPPSSHSPAIAAQLLIERCHVPGQCAASAHSLYCCIQPHPPLSTFLATTNILYASVYHKYLPGL